MLFLRCFLLASAPALFWLWVFYRRDRFEPEPKRLVLKLFFCGALAAVPVYFLQIHLPGPPTLAYDVFVRVALPEEVFKFLPVLWFARRRKEFNEPMDGIVYAVAAALGFATVENALYAMTMGKRIIVQRAFTATLAHVGLSGLVGYHLGKSMFSKRRPRLLVARALAAVIVLHAVYDLLLEYGTRPGAPPILARATIVVMVSVLLLMLSWAVRKADRASPFRGAAPGPGARPRREPTA